MLSVQTLEFAPYPFKHLNSLVILSNIGFHTLSFETLEFASFSFKHWNSHLVLTKIGICTLSFKYWNLHLMLLTEILEFAPDSFITCI